MKRQNWYILPDALPYVFVGLVFTVLVYTLYGPFPAVAPALLTFFVLFFFRNPHRTAAVEQADVLSPADGVILAVEEVIEERFLQEKAIKISIFLNVFNVHVNRVPISGKVEYLAYQPGKFLPAFKGHASTINERNYVGIRSLHNPNHALLVVQITGFIARRIVCWAKKGDVLEQGARFGLIKFGSCTEVYLPSGSLVQVEKGQKVRGGQTIIGRLRNE